jgi:transposase-like protein
MKYIPYKDRKPFVADLKTVYTAVNEEVALENLISLKDKWSDKYPTAIKRWEDNWDNLSTFFTFPNNIRKIIYTTNVIESLNSQFRKVTKTKLIFPNDDSLLKMLYLAVQRIAKKWTRNYPEWDIVMNQLNIVFSDILEKKA